MITRDIINPNLILYQHNQQTLALDKTFNYQQFCEMIDFWKLILVDKYNAQAGEQCLIDFRDLNAYYYSAIFAAAELGLVLIVDIPHCYNDQDIHSYRVNMHGKIDYIITQHHKYDTTDSGYNYWDCKRDEHLGRNIIFQEDLADYVVQNNDLFKTVSALVRATPDSTLVHSASSGTTGTPKVVVNSHRKVHFMAERLGRLLQFRPEDRVLHVRNIHHGASMVYHLLPAFMIAQEQYTYVPAKYNELDTMIEFVQQNKINHLFMYLQQLLDTYLESTPRVEHYVKVTTLFHITERSVELVKEKNIQWIKSLYGDTTIGLGLFLKHVDQTTDPKTYSVANQGRPLDDAFGIAVIKGLLHINSPALGQDWETSNDKFDVINGDYYFRGRANKYRINEEWIEQSAIESEVKLAFGDDANIVVDNEREKIYLAVWKENTAAETAVNQYFTDTYDNVSISYVMRGENRDQFFHSRKIDLNKIRDYCRVGLGIRLEDTFLKGKH